MLRRETAYRLAGRRHQPADALPEDAMCRREITLDPVSAGQLDDAIHALASIPGVTVERSEHPDSVVVSYNLASHSCDELEEQLKRIGVELDHSLYARLMRAMVHFCEDTRRRNMSAPQRLIKQSNEVYVKAYEHHPHGDHDDTPPDLREYK